MKIKKGDKVEIIAGKDKNKSGKVLAVDSKNNKVIVEGVNMVKKHVKANAQNAQGGIISKEAAIDVSNVMYLYKGEPTRIGYKIVTDKDGKTTKQRFAKSNGDIID